MQQIYCINCKYYHELIKAVTEIFLLKLFPGITINYIKIIYNNITIENSKTLKYHFFFNKTLVPFIILDKFGNNNKRYLKRKNQFRY